MRTLADGGWRLEINTLKDSAPAALQDNAQKENKTASNEMEESMRKLASMLDRSGIKVVYDATQQKQITEQEYASDIREAVASSKCLKLLTIAGYEYLGKGQDSLLYDIILANKSLTLEVVLLDPSLGEKVIKERVSKLKTRDGTYNAIKLKSQIADTKKTLKDFKLIKAKNVKLWLNPNHPVFRLLILDECLFFSTYALGHGHEAPVYQIAKDNNSGTGSSWYESFVKVFENAKNASIEQNFI